jgi:hypothetical protein
MAKTTFQLLQRVEDARETKNKTRTHKRKNKKKRRRRRRRRRRRETRKYNIGVRGEDCQQRRDS